MNIALLCGYITSYLSISRYIYLGYLYILAVVNDAAMIVSLQVFM